MADCTAEAAVCPRPQIEASFMARPISAIEADSSSAVAAGAPTECRERAYSPHP